MDVFDHEDQWRPLADLAYQLRDRLARAAIARGVVHGVIERPQRGRLSQVQQIIQVDSTIGRHEALGQCVLGRPLDVRPAAPGPQFEQAAQQCADRVLTGACSEVQDKPAVAVNVKLDRPVLKLLYEASLADSCIAADKDGLSATGFQTRAERAHELVELGPPADERAPARFGCLPQPEQLPRDYGFGKTFDRERAEGRALNPLRQQAPYGIRNQSRTRFRGIREARRQVHGITRNRILLLATAQDAARHDLPARDADVNPELAADLPAQLRHRFLNCERRPNRSLRVVVVRDRGTEHSHDAVTDMPLDAAPERLDDSVDPFEEAGGKFVDDLGADLPGHLGVTSEIGE